MKKRARGMTLSELLIVVIIVGMLSSVALIQYRRAIDRSYEGEAEVTLDLIMTAEYLYYREFGDFVDPPTTALQANIPNTIEYWSLNPMVMRAVAIDEFGNSYTSSITITYQGTGGRSPSHNHTGHNVSGMIDTNGNKTITKSGAL